MVQTADSWVVVAQAAGTEEVVMAEVAVERVEVTTAEAATARAGLVS